MTITAIMFAANDEDVVESSVRHNLCYVDAVFVVGLGSEDGTRDIVEQLAGEGLPAAFSHAPGAATIGHHATATLRQLDRHGGTDHVAVMTADQFLQGPPDVLRERLAAAPHAVHWAERRVRVPTEADDWTEPDPLRRIRHRRLAEMAPRHLAVLPRDAFCHVVVDADGLFGSEAFEDGHRLDGMSVAQLPVRNAFQFASLVVSRAAEMERLVACGVEDRRERVLYWRAMAEEVGRDLLLRRAALRAAAAGFESRDPLPLVEDEPWIFPDHGLHYPATVASLLNDDAELLAALSRRGRAKIAQDAQP
jgi:hypothetical protein